MRKIKASLFYLLIIVVLLCGAYRSARSQIMITISKKESTTWLRNNRYIPSERTGSADYYEDPYFGIEKVEKKFSSTGTDLDDPYRTRQGDGLGSPSSTTKKWVPYYTRPSNCSTPTYQPEKHLNSQKIDELPATRPAQIIYQPRALYSKDDYLARRQAAIRLQVQLKADGTVGSIRPLSTPSGSFVQNAMQAACYLTFQPAFAGGKPVDSVRTINYTFSLDQIHETEAAKYPPPPPLDAAVKIISRQRAFYTPEAKQNQVQGNVVLRVTFLASGRIGAVEPIEKLPNGLTEKAIEAAQQIKFEPARKNGENITQTKTVSYNFTLY